MKNFIAPAKRKSSAARIWAVHSRRLAVLALEVDMAFSVVARRPECPRGFGIRMPSTITSNGQALNRQAANCSPIHSHPWGLAGQHLDRLRGDRCPRRIVRERQIEAAQLCQHALFI